MSHHHVLDWPDAFVASRSHRFGHSPKDSTLSVTFPWLGLRWQQDRIHSRSGWHTRRFSIEESCAFGFLDHVVCAVHLIPAFASNRTADLLPPSIARPLSYNYYISTFVDRAMFMRFRGGGIGHKTTRHASDMFLNDRRSLDLKRQRSDDPDSNEDMDVENSDATIHNGDEDEIADEETDYGYTNLDAQGVEEEEDEEEGKQNGEEPEDDGRDGDDALGPEDGEGADDETETLGFATL